MSEAKLYVGNLSYNVSEDDLRQLFTQAGEVKEVSLILDRETRRPKGFGFVEMATSEQATAAIQKFNNFDLQGRPMTVSIARPREERGGGPRGGGGGYGSGRSGGRGGRGGRGGGDRNTGGNRY